MAPGDGASGRPPGFCDNPDHTKASAHRRRTELRAQAARSAAEAPADDPERPVEMSEIRGRDLLREAGRLLAQQQRTSTEQAGVFAALLEQLQTLGDPEAVSVQIEAERATHAAELAHAHAELARVQQEHAELAAQKEEAEAAAEEAIAGGALWLMVAANALHREASVRAEAAERIAAAHAEAAATVEQVQEEAAAVRAEAATVVETASKTVDEAKAALVAAREKAAEEVAQAAAERDKLRQTATEEKGRAEDLHRRYAALADELATERAEAHDARRKLREEFAEERGQFEQQLKAAIQRAADANTAADELRRELTKNLLPAAEVPAADARTDSTAAEVPAAEVPTVEVPEAPAGADAEAELLAAVEPFLSGAEPGLSKQAAERLQELRRAVETGETDKVVQARAAVGALRVNAMRLPATPRGTRLRGALETYTGETTAVRRRQPTRPRGADKGLPPIGPVPGQVPLPDEE
ncbi:hypothetical protein [Kitasatospora sp. NPDC057595]|uniref:hypothetical protein n=1 Tax=Kitasatospora sp. NPDC057595 TaxID=3346177 RepID=UPI0036B988D9